MKTSLVCYLLGVATPFVGIAVAKLIERPGMWVRSLLGLRCPICHGDGYIEDVDVGSRSVSLWPCKCKAGSAYAKKLRGELHHR